MKTFLFMILTLFVSSCNGYLDYKPNIKMAIPSSLKDAELLLSNYSAMNMGYPNQGEISSDDYFLTTDNWTALSEIDERNLYIWSDQLLTNASGWQNSYKVIYLTNQIFEMLGNINASADQQYYDRISGTAHFFRAFAFHQLVSTYTVGYVKGRAHETPGIPLRLSPNIDEKVPRSSLEDSYKKIIEDSEFAINKLQKTATVGLPDKAAAFALLARTYLDMQDYDKAYRYADSSLQLKAFLQDFNQVDQDAYLPFDRFNKEVLFAASANFSEALAEYYLLVDTSLFSTYDNSDLRKSVFFKTSPGNEKYLTFKGSYDNSYGSPFVGLAVDEMYLIRSECASRNNNIDRSLQDLNYLRERRYELGKYRSVTERNPTKLLAIILQERRKELLFRGRRWSDLKRLNLDENFKKTLERNIGDKKLKLEPNSLAYGIFLPNDAVNIGGLIQNAR